jgi:hypothetical protein
MELFLQVHSPCSQTTRTYYEVLDTEGLSQRPPCISWVQLERTLVQRWVFMWDRSHACELLAWSMTSLGPGGMLGCRKSAFWMVHRIRCGRSCSAHPENCCSGEVLSGEKKKPLRGKSMVGTSQVTSSSGLDVSAGEQMAPPLKTNLEDKI